jgi:hypothetical protein
MKGEPGGVSERRDDEREARGYEAPGELSQ